MGSENIHALRIADADEMILYKNQMRMFFVIDKRGSGFRNSRGVMV